MTPAEIRAASRALLVVLYQEGNAETRIMARDELDRRGLEAQARAALRGSPSRWNWPDHRARAAGER